MILYKYSASTMLCMYNYSTGMMLCTSIVLYKAMWYDAMCTSVVLCVEEREIEMCYFSYHCSCGDWVCSEGTDSYGGTR